MDGEGPVVKSWGDRVSACCLGIITNNAFTLQHVLGWKRNSIVILLWAWALEWVWPGFKPQPCNAVAEWPWTRYLSSVNVSFPICRKRVSLSLRVMWRDRPHTESARWVSSHSRTQNIRVHAPHLWTHLRGDVECFEEQCTLGRPGLVTRQTVTQIQASPLPSPMTWGNLNALSETLFAHLHNGYKLLRIFFNFF